LFPEDLIMAKKMINQAENLVNELLEGFTLAYGDKVKLVGENLVARTKRKARGKVALVTLGGSGHEPGLSGFVGRGLLDISVPGEIFAAPGPQRCLDAIERADRGAGVLFVVLNHAGDVLTANLTMEIAREKAFPVEMLVVHDDIASGPAEKPEERRGLVGFLPVIKVAGAAAERRYSLDEVMKIAHRMGGSMRTLAVAFSPPTHPITGDPMFELDEDEMALGMGQHGEAGVDRVKMSTADETAELMLERLLADLGVAAGEELLVILNGAGATTMMELYIVYRRMRQILKQKKIKIARSLIGEYITTQEQAGFQMLIAAMDQEMLTLWDAPCDSPCIIIR
jgi:dihydroxyacetone kinase-like protein